MAINISGHYDYPRDEGQNMLDAYGASVGYSNPYPTGTPDPNYPDCDYDFDHDDRDQCEIPGFDDPEDEDSQAGSVPKNTCYVNGFEADCNDVASHPDLYEPDPGAFRLFRDNATGKYALGLNTNTGYYVPQFNGNQVSYTDRTGRHTTNYASTFEGYRFVESSSEPLELDPWDLRDETSQQQPKSNTNKSDENPNCIANALPNGKVTNRKGYDLTSAHDGIHVYSESGGKEVNVTALSAMAGTITRVRLQPSGDKDVSGPDLYRIDILLNEPINGERYYLILKDLTQVGTAAGGGRIGARNLKINGTENLGRVRGEVSPSSIDYKGLHVTLVSAANYSKLVNNIQKGQPSPKEWFMGAATDSNSPFRCK